MDPQRLAIYLDEKSEPTQLAPSGPEMFPSHTAVKEYNNKHNTA